MFRQAAQGRSGMALVTTLLIMLLLFGITGSVVVVFLAESREVDALADTHTAFYLAEAGLDAAKYEITENVDADGDGLGTKATTTTTGTYAVTAEDLGGGSYRLVSRGNANESNVTLQSAIGCTIASRFPQGAVSIVGETGVQKLMITKPDRLVIDGGDSSAVVISDRLFYDKFYNTIKNAIDSNEISESDITGSIEGGSGTDLLPISHQPEYADSLGDLTALYDAITNRVHKTIIPATTPVSQGSTDVVTYGSPTQPATIYLANDMQLKHGGVISGYGTLVVSHTLAVMAGGKIDWTGDVIVIGDSRTNAKIDVSGGELGVTGNLIVQGVARDFSELKISNYGKVRVDGSLLVASEYKDNMNSEAKLNVEKTGELRVEGLVTILGKKVEARIKDDARFRLDGMLQVGFPQAAHWTAEDLKFKMELRGDVEIHRSGQQIIEGVASLNDFGVKYDIPEMSSLVRREIISYSWWRSGN
jgi:hypothetical protein